MMETASNGAGPLYYKTRGWTELMRWPPPDNPINLASWLCQMMTNKTWAQHWFDTARRAGPCQVGGVEPAGLCPFSTTGGSTVSLHWTYDGGIDFKIGL